MSDGLRAKYIVQKAETGEAVEDCFVLRPEKDPAAIAAIRAYAAATNNPALSADLLRWVGPLPNNPLTLDELKEMDGEPVWIGPWKLWGLVSVSDEAIATCGYGRFPFCLCKNSIYNNIYRQKPEEA